MRPDARKSGADCANFDVAAYLDGELSPSEEILIEQHFAVCTSCLSEFDLQKRLLSALDSAMAEGPALKDVPANFARVVTVNAESSVSGIRNPSERFRAVFVCAFLLLLVTVSLGTDAGSVAFDTSQKAAQQAFSVAGFLVHFVFEVGTGIGVVLRYVGHGVVYNSLVSAAASLLFFTLSSVALSRMVVRYNRGSKA
ncbi:MAG: zf-HC2 domain-containing protein [Acidobacteriota bacterium]|nr:MAG: zf-HC2 domain-containing protein [Acidobacteriota bacterium]